MFERTAMEDFPAVRLRLLREPSNHDYWYPKLSFIESGELNDDQNNFIINEFHDEILKGISLKTPIAVMLVKIKGSGGPVPIK